jgi:hypothetical protein
MPACHRNRMILMFCTNQIKTQTFEGCVLFFIRIRPVSSGVHLEQN